MKKAYILAATLVLIGLPGAFACAAERLGTLLYSPAERTGIVMTRNGESVEETGEIRTTLEVSGFVKRTDGKGTVWINGHAVEEGQALSHGSKPKISTSSVGIDGKSVRARETLDLGSGKQSDFLPEGSFKVRKPR